MEPSLFALLTFGGVSTGAAAVVLIARDQAIRDVPDRPDATTELQRFSSPWGVSGEAGIARFDRWFERTVYLSRLPISTATASLFFPFVALLLGGAAFLLSDDFIVALSMAVLGMAVTLGLLVGRAWRCRTQMEAQLPDALDLLSRAVRSGQSFEQAMLLVSESSPEPLAAEFRRCSGHLAMGLSVAATMRAMSDRLHLMDVRILASTLSVHRDSGGSLATTLERLSAVIRDRMAYRRQLRSVTSAGRFSAAIITLLAPLLFVYLFVFQPEYGQALWQDPLGRSMLIYAAISELIGLIWVMRILKNDY
jgi:tight adherence protein B